MRQACYSGTARCIQDLTRHDPLSNWDVQILHGGFSGDPTVTPLKPTGQITRAHSAFKGQACPSTTIGRTMSFSSFTLNENLLKAIHNMGFEHPTPIQRLAIPP